MSSHATGGWTVEKTLPTAPTLTSTPSSISNSSSASVSFRGEANATFAYKLDAGSWTTCTDPKTHNTLTELLAGKEVTVLSNPDYKGSDTEDKSGIPQIGQEVAMPKILDLLSTFSIVKDKDGNHWKKQPNGNWNRVTESERSATGGADMNRDQLDPDSTTGYSSELFFEKGWFPLTVKDLPAGWKTLAVGDKVSVGEIGSLALAISAPIGTQIKTADGLVWTKQEQKTFRPWTLEELEALPLGADIVGKDGPLYRKLESDNPAYKYLWYEVRKDGYVGDSSYSPEEITKFEWADPSADIAANIGIWTGGREHDYILALEEIVDKMREPFTVVANPAYSDYQQQNEEAAAARLHYPGEVVAIGNYEALEALPVGTIVRGQTDRDSRWQKVVGGPQSQWILVNEEGKPIESEDNPELTVRVGPLTDGLHTIQVRQTDRSGKTSTSATASWIVDTVDPEVTSLAPTSQDPTTGSTLSFSLTFDSPIAGLSAADFETGGSSRGWSIDSISGTGTGPYTIHMTATDPQEGNVTLALSAGSVSDAAGNFGPTSKATASSSAKVKPTPDVGLRINDISFSDVPIYARASGPKLAARDKPLTITNIGRSKVVLGAPSYVSDYKSVGEPCQGKVLAPGESCQQYVRFVPTALGERAGSVTFAVADNPSLKFRATLAGNGIRTPAVQSEPDSPKSDLESMQLKWEATPGRLVGSRQDAPAQEPRQWAYDD